MSLQKPVMRGLLAKRLRFHLPIAFTLALVAAAAFKVRESDTYNMATLNSVIKILNYTYSYTEQIFGINILIVVNFGRHSNKISRNCGEICFQICFS